MSKTKISMIDYRLEPAYLDWRDLHTQMAVGMAAIFFLCLVNFLSITQFKGADNTVISLCLRVIDFALYYMSCLLTALLALQMTGRFGNRYGAGCAIWAALIFCVIPAHAYLCTPAGRAARVLGFVILFLAYWWMRSGTYSDKCMVWFLLLLVPIFSLDAYLSQSSANNFQSEFRYFFFHSDIPHEFLGQSYILLIVCIIAILLFFTRFFLNTISSRAFGVVILCYLAAIAALSFQIFEYFRFPWFAAFDVSIRSLLGPALLAITFSLACLPAIDNARIGISRALSIIGVIVLVILTVNLESLFTSQENNPAPFKVRKF